jgi:hypothetical protein
MEWRMLSVEKIFPLCIVAVLVSASLPGQAEERLVAPPPPLPPAVSAADLGDVSGGASPTNMAISSQIVTAVNSGNSISADSVVTGDVNLQSGAFNGFTGVGNFVFNTGNNNNLQGTLSVTILTPVN